jgi:hypothetical protein
LSAQRAAQLVEAGLFLKLSGDLDGAKRLFEQALRLDPTNPRAKQLLEGGSAAAAPPQPARQGPPAVAPLAGPLGNPPPAAPRAFSPPPVAPAASSGFDADWGSVMDGGSGGAPSPWDAPATTAPVAPMGAPVTTTMAFPLNEARALSMDPPARAPVGAPMTSTMAFPMSSLPAAQLPAQPPSQAPVGAPMSSTMAFPMSALPAAQAPMGAPPTSTLAYPMSSADGAPAAHRTGWTPPPLVRPGAPSPQPEPPSPEWGAPATSTMAFPMSPQTSVPAADGWAPAAPAQDPWAEPTPAADPWKAQPEPADPWKAAPQPDEQHPWSAAPPPSNNPWNDPPPAAAPAPQAPWDAPADSGWGAPPTSTLAFPMSPQRAPEPEPVPIPAAPADPWAAFKVQGGAAPSGDTDSAMWNSVSLAPQAAQPSSYAPPAVNDPYAQPAPAEDDWSQVAPRPATPTAPQGVPSSPRPAALAASVAPVPPAAPEPVPWDSPVPVEPPPRPRPAPVAFADWAQPTDDAASAAPGPWSTGETPVHPMPAPSLAAEPPLSLQPLAPMLPGPPPPRPAFADPVAAQPARPPIAQDDTDDIEVVEDEGEVFGHVAPQPPAPVAAAPRHAMATGIPEAPQWEDPGIDAAVVDDNDTLDNDFSFNAPPPAVVQQPVYQAPPAPVFQPPPPPPAPSGPPPLPAGYEASLVSNAQSAWDSTSNPGLKLDANAAPKAGDAFDLIQQDALARKAVAPEPDKKDKLASLIRRAKDLIGLDDHTGAMALISQADALAPNDGEVKKLKDRSEATLQRMYESKIGNLERVPRVKLKETEIIWLNLDHRAGFMLAQVDGNSTFEDLFALSGMSRLDTARILAQLIDEGVIVV